MIILAPEQLKPEPAPIKPVLVTDYFEYKLVEAIGQPDDQPVPLWPVIREIVEGERPINRTERRRLVGRLLCRAHALLRRGVIVREDNAHVRLTDPVTPPLPPPTKPVKNLPPASHLTVVEMGKFHPGGTNRRTFRV